MPQTQIIYLAKKEAIEKNIKPRNVENGVSRALTKPRIVIGAITGATKMFAGIVAIDNSFAKSKMTGRQNMVVLIGIEIPSSNQSGVITLLNFSCNLGASISIPAVANTERANPGSSP
jgi:hypothetical protein